MKRLDEPLFDKESGTEDQSSEGREAIERQIRDLLSQQPFCVLCTQGERQPYGSLIAFAATDDLKSFYFTTPTATRKYKLLSGCPHVALVVDSRCRHPSDMTRIEAVTITAHAVQIDAGPRLREGHALLEARHPYLSEFLKAESTALFHASVIRCFHVTRFQEVTQWIP